MNTNEIKIGDWVEGIETVAGVGFETCQPHTVGEVCGFCYDKARLHFLDRTYGWLPIDCLRHVDMTDKGYQKLFELCIRAGA